MKKQIIIKHSSNDAEIIINEIMKYLDILVPSQSRIICSFCLHEKDLPFWNDINKDIKSIIVQRKANRKSIFKNEYLDIELSILYEDIIRFLQAVEKYELNMVIRYKSALLCLNDNDGDFIVINSKDILYPKIKEISLNK